MRKSDKKVSSKYLVLGIIFIVTMVLTFLSMSFESVTPSATTMSAATIPVITMQSEEGNEFNSLHGFTQEINQALINDITYSSGKDKTASYYYSQLWS